MSKGSRQRPPLVSQDTLQDNWSQTFGTKKLRGKDGTEYTLSLRLGIPNVSPVKAPTMSSTKCAVCGVPSRIHVHACRPDDLRRIIDSDQHRR